ncbi:MAG: GGDEF domain-containing protein [Verrucomicrobiia bacterium]
MSAKRSFNVLFVQDHPELGRRFARVCGQLAECEVTCYQSRTASDAVPFLEGGTYSIALVDLTRSHGLGLGEVAELAMRAPEVPLVVIVDPGDRAAGHDGVAAGASDWLPLDAEAELVNRCFLYVLERVRLRESLRQMSLIDDATGLYNGAGLETVIRPHVILLQRMKKPSLMFALDLYNLGDIQAKRGRHEVQNAVLQAARILRTSFRASDVVARLATSEFAVFAPDIAEDHAPGVLQRLKGMEERVRAAERWPFHLQFRAGYYRPDLSRGVDANAAWAAAREVAQEI